jgi:hypothetical protein
LWWTSAGQGLRRGSLLRVEASGASEVSAARWQATADSYEVAALFTRWPSDSFR